MESRVNEGLTHINKVLRLRCFNSGFPQIPGSHDERPRYYWHKTEALGCSAE